jgi:DNA-binding response OmpR family regulator
VKLTWQIGYLRWDGNMKKIVIVEDEVELAEITRSYLVKEGYNVKIISDGKEALDYLMVNSVDLLILDIMLPDVDGYTICEEVRKKSNIPIMIISARHEEEDKILGLELGADDYIEKPFSVKELVARVKAQMRRKYDYEKLVDKIVDGKLIIDTLSRMVYLNEIPISFSVKEYDLLKLLVENKGRVMKKETLFNQVWGLESFSEFSTLTVHINKLREKLEENPRKPKLIVTIWGMGYKYEGWK